ncbi:hypothetical protein IBBPl23_28 [Paenibacillus phage phiIBB_P123]|uniref:Uncharacterized protein n=1 Tax=Paenibacillus phage phiIBB_P123 TaxID=1337877 RepID=R9VY90_9CAUD|nr:hypothetical protein IBBPl23_28 [Paenibacillus phage phiIBB_P123]AGN89345.1 hypothetical protein IBBPl23_28 [Paenibacillus phage phiIBB_P123]
MKTVLYEDFCFCAFISWKIKFVKKNRGAPIVVLLGLLFDIKRQNSYMS